MSRLEYRVEELARRLNNLLRVGTIHAADYNTARVRVASGGVVTAWLPWLTLRSGSDRSWWAPEVDEQVLLLSPGGDPAQGVVLPAVYQDAYPAPASSPDIDRRVYADGAVVEYDRAAHVLTAKIPGDVVVKAEGNITATAGANITGEAGSGIELTAPHITLNGKIMLNGPLTHGGGSLGGDARLNGKLHVRETITTDADVKARVSLNNHTHGCREGGTSTPNG